MSRPRRKLVVGTAVQTTLDGVAAVDRALAVLQAFKAETHVMALSELATITGLYRSTILRLVNSLLGGGFLERLPDGRYQVGSAPSQGWSPTGAEPGGADGHPVRAEDRTAMGVSARRDRMRIRDELLTTAARPAAGQGPDCPAPGPAGVHETDWVSGLAPRPAGQHRCRRQKGASNGPEPHGSWQARYEASPRRRRAGHAARRDPEWREPPRQHDAGRHAGRDPARTLGQAGPPAPQTWQAAWTAASAWGVIAGSWNAPMPGWPGYAAWPCATSDATTSTWPSPCSGVPSSA